MFFKEKIKWLKQFFRVTFEHGWWVTLRKIARKRETGPGCYKTLMRLDYLNMFPLQTNYLWTAVRY
jgi:hypothetical protein